MDEPETSDHSTGHIPVRFLGAINTESFFMKTLLDIVKAVAEAVDIPVICNGGSKEIEKYSDIAKFREQCGASSIMIARAAEWNVTIFRPQGLLPVMDVIKLYLKLSVDYDSVSANSKYCVQNILRDLQESELGKRFLESQTMEQLCEVFDLKSYCKQKQLEHKKKEMELRREEASEDASEDEPTTKRAKLDEGTIEEKLAFIRSNYIKDTELPKSILHMHTKKKLRTVPDYVTHEQDRLFTAVLTLNGKKYSSTFLEKNKRNAEQGAAMVCLLHLGLISKKELLENGSMDDFEM